MKSIYMFMFTGGLAVQAAAEPETAADMQQRIADLESRLSLLEAPTISSSADNRYNPSISIILDGVYASYDNNPNAYSIPGYALGGESSLADEGFSIGHSELTLSSNIDDKFYAKFTVAFADHDGATEVELEEAFFETLSLGQGFTIRGGRFYSAIGYLNQQHNHAWDFYDAPLIYRALFGYQYVDDGLRLSYIAPTDIFLELGAEALSGKKYPAGDNDSNQQSWVGFINVGGDIGFSHSWQLGLSYWQADDVHREYGAHAHDASLIETPVFEGDSDVLGVNAVYKWAPDGNYREQNIKLQFEYFQRDDDGQVIMAGTDPLESSTLSGMQDGWYSQLIWQFDQNWRTGVRYDVLASDNSGSDPDVLNEAGLLANGYRPKRQSAMLEWIPSEFSRIRLQYNHDESWQQADSQWYLQYTFSLGAHGAHAY